MIRRGDIEVNSNEIDEVASDYSPCHKCLAQWNSFLQGLKPPIFLAIFVGAKAVSADRQAPTP